MPNLAKVLKDEIRRISKSEAKITADPLRKTIAELRTKLWALQRRGYGAGEASCRTFQAGTRG